MTWSELTRPGQPRLRTASNLRAFISSLTSDWAAAVMREMRILIMRITNSTHNNYRYVYNQKGNSRSSRDKYHQSIIIIIICMQSCVSVELQHCTDLPRKMFSDCSETKYGMFAMFPITFDILHPVGIFLVSFLLSQNIIYTKNIYILFYMWNILEISPQWQHIFDSLFVLTRQSAGNFSLAKS